MNFNSQMLSNIHTVRAVWNPLEEKTWKFASRVRSDRNSVSKTLQPSKYGLVWWLKIKLRVYLSVDFCLLSVGFTHLPLVPWTIH